MKVLEHIVSVLQLLPYPLRPLVPLWIVGGTLAVLIAGLAVAVVHLNSVRYHLTAWTGEPESAATEDDKAGRRGEFRRLAPAAHQAALGSDAKRAY